MQLFLKKRASKVVWPTVIWSFIGYFLTYYGVKNSENGVSYVLKPGSTINVYATLNNDYALNGLFKDVPKQTIGDEYSGYSIINILSDVKILSTFDENGEEVENTQERNIDTILIAVTKEEATKINLIRDVAAFNITEM